MTRRTRIGITALVAIAFSFMCNPSDAAPFKNNRMVSGQQGLENIDKLMTSVPWYTSMAYAKKKAVKEDKPIFWVHMLGPMNGDT
jgi:hypothetical protein